MTRRSLISATCLSIALQAAVPGAIGLAAGGYAVVVSKATRDDPEWAAVVEALVRKHGATAVFWEKGVSESLGPLREVLPRYIAFVARPEESGREFVIAVHRLARRLDDDPYADALWGIVTGCRPEHALRIARAKEPLIVRRAAGGTGIDLDLFEEGVWYSECEKGVCFEKKRGGAAEKKTCPGDTTKALVDVFNEFRPDVFVTSGHATDRDWQIGYSYKNGQFRSRDGALFGLDLEGNEHPIASSNPKVYLPAGNCLMGRIRDRDSMALAWMGSGGVNQMIGYVVSTWYGRAGWGTLEYFFKDAGRHTLSEAFFLNEQRIIHELVTRFPSTSGAEWEEWDIETDPRLLLRLAASLGYREWTDDVKDNAGLLWDRDTLAFYGDPAWEARLAPRKLPFETKLWVRGKVYALEIHAGEDCQPFRPVAALLPHRVRGVEILEGAELGPVVADDFVLVTKPGRFERGKTYRVRFRAERM